MKKREEVKVKKDVYAGGVNIPKGSRFTVVKDQGHLGVLINNPNKGERDLVPSIRLFNHEVEA